MSGETDVETQQNFTTTEVQKETINFKWDSGRLQRIVDNPTEVHFQQIYLEGRDKSKWHLRLGVSIYNGIKINVYCRLESSTINKLKQFAVWEIFAIKEDGETVTKLEMQDNYKRGNVFQHTEERQIATWSNLSTVDGILKLKGKLVIYNGSKTVDSSPIFPLSSFEKSSVSELQRDMSDLLLTATEDEKFADVELSMDDGTVLRAHRGILAARSDYFRAMLSSGMVEETTGKISIEGINGKAMKVLLHFLYSGRLSEDWSDAEVLHDFTKAAHRYQIMTLVEFLDANIVKVCDPCFAGELLLLCKTLEMKTAENGLRQLIKTNLKQIGGEPEFDDLLVLIAKRQKVLKQ